MKFHVIKDPKMTMEKDLKAFLFQMIWLWWMHLNVAKDQSQGQETGKDQFWIQ